VTAIPLTGRGIETAGARTGAPAPTAARRWVNAIPVSSSLIVSVLVACLWGLHAAAPSVPGRLYVRLPLMLVIGMALLMRRAKTRAPGVPFAKNGLVVGLCCWLIAATLSTVLNWQTESVLATYFVVFVCGAFIYATMSHIDLSRTEVDIAIAGLLIGSLFPLINGLQTFGTEFGPTDATMLVAAYTNRIRMGGYEIATFGNRGNTAAFLLILAPILLAVMLDAKRHWMFRAVCALSMVPVVLNFLIIQVRAGFLTLIASAIVVYWFKRGARQLPLFIAGLVVVWLFLFNVAPDAGWMIRDRIVAAVTLDTDGDTSVQGRAEALQEGVRLAKRYWLLGVGPGGGPTVHSRDSAHQFQINQAMETGILGFFGTTLLTVSLFICLIRTMARGRDDETNDVRFMLLIGPASYLAYSVTVNAALNNSSVNTWTVLVVSMLALMPQFEPRRVRAARR
jgi:hypothetical protein